MTRLKNKPGTYAANEGIWLRAIIGVLSTVPFDFSGMQ